MAKEKPRQSRKKREKKEEKKEFEYDGFHGKAGIDVGIEIKKQPGKHRFFEQNYKHDVISEDKYAILYELELNEQDYGKVLRRFESTDISLEFDENIKELINETFLVTDSWSRFEQDMRLLSQKFKGMLFTVRCTGEDFPYDFFTAFALGGKYYEQENEIKYAAFNIERLI